MLIEFFNENSGAIQAIATIFLVAITSYYVYLTNRSVEFTKKLLKIEQTRDEKKAKEEKRPIMEHPKL